MTKHDNFEDGLLAELRQVVAERQAPTATAGSRRRKQRLVLAGAAGMATLTAAAIVAGGGDGTPSAYAVDTNPDGSVTVSVKSLSDGGGLQESLSVAGVPAVVDYAASECGAPAADESGAPGVAASVEAIPSVPAKAADAPTVQPGLASEIPVSGDGGKFTVDPAEIESGEVLYVTSGEKGKGEDLLVKTIPASEACEAGAPVPTTEGTRAVESEPGVGPTETKGAR